MLGLARRFRPYNSCMKTSVSIPDDILDEAERLARLTKRSRSRLFSDALRQYVASRSQQNLTRQMNAALAEIGKNDSEFSASASRLILQRSDF